MSVPDVENSFVVGSPTSAVSIPHCIVCHHHEDQFEHYTAVKNVGDDSTSRCRLAAERIRCEMKRAFRRYPGFHPSSFNWLQMQDTVLDCMGVAPNCEDSDSSTWHDAPQEESWPKLKAEKQQKEPDIPAHFWDMNIMAASPHPQAKHEACIASLMQELRVPSVRSCLFPLL